MPAPACKSFSLLVRDGVRLRRVRGLLAVNRHGRVLWRERRFSSRLQFARAMLPDDALWMRFSVPRLSR